MPRSSDRPPGVRRTVAVVDVETSVGTARAHVEEPDATTAPDAAPAGVLVLGHGAGGGIRAPDLQAATVAAVGAGWRVVLVEQPWKVAGGKVAPAPARLDTGWLAVLAELAGRGVVPAPDGGGPAAGRLVVGGRSAGARVACRTARTTGAAAVLCLAFPLHPPGRPERSRAEELAGAGVPVHVVQGRRDPFGGPGEIEALGLPGVHVVPVEGDHGLKASAGSGDAVAAAVRAVLES